ncbi:MAG: 50S ribosomal protein L9 [bacterium]
MKIVLYKDVENLGDAFEVVKVADGYARNYLFPRNLAGPATAAALAMVEKKQAELEQKRAAKRAEFETLAEKISGLEIVIAVDVAPEGKLFGSVTSQNIIEATLAQAGIELDKKKIDLAEPIKAVGEYSLPVKLFKNISAKLRVKVEAKK